MRSVVTGVAGFIGSHLAERLLAEGQDVLGIDCLTSYYDPAIKRANLEPLCASPRFQFVQADLTYADVRPLLEDAAYVFHLAGQPGVRPSWDDHFACYTAYNVLATQRLLQAVRDFPIHKLVYASSSSVYGTGHSPLGEAMQPNPRSPYGVTKLAGEQLCNLFWTEYGTPVIALRYFTVYGPRQRPDMAIHRFIRALLRDEPVTLYGDGRQARGFTYVDDVVDATLRAATVPETGISINVGSEAGTSLQEVLAILGREAHCTLRVQYQASQAGDIAYTAAESMRARQVLGFVPRVSLQEGLRRQLIWQRAM